MNLDHDLLEFVDHVEDNHCYLPVPRTYIRDADNPLELYSNMELLQRFRFSRATIQDILLPLVYPNGEIRSSNRGLPVLPIIKLCAALRFYATGSMQRVCGDLHAISQPTVSRIVKEVSERLCLNLPQFIKFPSQVELEAVRMEFMDISGFPGVVGAIDGSHIEIKSPGGPRAEVFRNRKSWMSINVQVVAGPRCQMFDIVIRWPGSTHDSRIFNNSSVKVRFEQQEVRGILLADSAYRQTHYMYTPVENPQTPAERRYNTAHTKGRNVVERTFGQWKQRFRAVHTCLNCSLRTSLQIIGATAVLHNIAGNREEFIPDSNFRPNEVPVPPVSQDARGVLIRRSFIERHFQN